MSRRVRPLVAGRRIRLGAHVWWDAATSGAFFTRASLWISLLIAVTVMAPFQHFDGADDHFRVLTVGILGWGVLVGALVPVAVAERRMRNRAARGVLVIGAVAVVAIARPFVNEGFFVALYGVAPDFVGLAARISSNLVVWIAGLSIIAITVRSVALTRGTRGRLADAIATLTAGQQHLARYESENRGTLACLVADLREQREAMLAGTIDFAAVRDYSESVRTASHRLEERSRLDLRVASVHSSTTATDAAAHRSALAMLRPPPYLLVGLVFMAGAVPYAHGVGGLATALWAVVVGVPITLAADLATRLLARGRSALGRGVVIVAAWVAAGILMTVLADALVASDDPSRFVPLVSVPIVAIALAACTDAIARAAVSAQRLEAVLAMVARTLTAKTARARRPLRNASHVLHGRVQGRCVLLAATADEWELTEKDVQTFRRDTDAAFDGILAFIAETDAASLEHVVQSAHEDLSELVATWSAVLEVSSEISDAAADALVDPEISRNVATVVNEGFVNAVKHSEAKAVWLSIGVESDALLVRTWSTGTLDRAPIVGPETRGISVLGVGARIFQRDDAVVLEVPVPLTAAAADAAPIARLPRRAWWTRQSADVG